MKSKITSIRGQRFVGVADLANEAAKILIETGPLQERGTVSEVPDERTIRYYLTEGLLSPAEDKQGTASVFGYLHLLQLLVVKKLQSEHLPIRKIKELVSGRSELELERLLGREEPSKEKNEALSYLESLLTGASASATHARPDSPSSLLLKRAAAPSMLAAVLPAEQASWNRFEIEPGLELHIRADYRPPADTRGLQQLARFLMRVIESHRPEAKKARK